MRKAVLSLTVLTASKRMMLTLFAACLVGMALLFGVGLRTAETQTTTASTTTYY
jgi:Tfp pilus assembly protein PilN